MKFVGAATLLLTANYAMAQQVSRVERGLIRLEIPTSGVVVADEVVSLNSTIPGRVEDILVSSTNTWVLNKNPMGNIASKDLTSMLDSPTTTDRAAVLEHWKSIFPLIPVRCPGDCYLLETLVSPQEWIKSGTPLFKAAMHLDLQGRVRAHDTPWIRDGQWVEYWDKAQPEKIYRLQVANFLLDQPEDPQHSAGSFSSYMPTTGSFPPGTQWEGVIIPIVHEHALKVPTTALISYGNAVYLPVLVSTGITQGDWTEITAGVEFARPILVLDDSKIKKAAHYTSEFEQNPERPSKQPAKPANIDYGKDIYSE